LYRFEQTCGIIQNWGLGQALDSLFSPQITEVHACIVARQDTQPENKLFIFNYLINLFLIVFKIKFYFLTLVIAAAIWSREVSW
jgi:hypothetical protein